MLNDPRFRVERETLVIPGLQHTYRVLHIADSHLNPDSPLDTDEIRQKAAKHREVWMQHGNGIEAADNMAAFSSLAAEEAVDLTVMCGDMTDFPSIGTADEGARCYETFGRYLYVPGNHEQGIRFPDYYRAATNGDPAFQMLDLGDVVFVGIDNGCHSVTNEALDALERVLHGDKPVILAHHIPIDCETLHPAAVDYWQDVTYFLFGLSGNGDNIERYIRLVSQEHTQLRAVLCGHLHFSHIDRFENGVTQYVAAPTMAGYGRVITITGA